MNATLTKLHRPDSNQTIGQSWFANIATHLLNETELMVNGDAHRLVEVECYYHSAEHPDPFAHCDPRQKTTGRWYFHREGGSYRSGSFKGLDITFGADPDAFGGILIRTLSKPDGSLVNGSSLCVDHLLSHTGYATMADLEVTIGTRSVTDITSPLHLHPLSFPDDRNIIPTARVGLTLKRMASHQSMPHYLMRPYRFLTEPTIPKGKIHTIIALHQEGLSPDEIRSYTRSPKRTIANAIARYTDGLQQDSFLPYQGRALKTEDLCTLHGICTATLFLANK